MKDLKIEEIKKIINDSYNKSEITRKLGMHLNGTSYRFITKFINDHNIDISHFDINKVNRKYPLVTKICPVCKIEFKTKLGSKDETTTCSYACSNTFFRSGADNG